MELDKELKLNENALEKKENGEKRIVKESPLKSNAMLTKSRKKKATSKRKSSIQSKNKELGRPISLNIIYEEPSQVPSTSDKETVENKVTSVPSVELKFNNESKDDKEIGQIVQDIQQESSEKETNNIAFSETKCSDNHSSNDSIKEIPEHKCRNQITESITAVKENANTVDETEENSFFPSPDDNWESRLSSIDYSTQAEEHGEPAPIASGVYYSEIPTKGTISENETLNNNENQPMVPSGFAPTGYVPMVQVFEIEPYTEAHWYPLDVVCRTFREQGTIMKNYW